MISQARSKWPNSGDGVSVVVPHYGDRALTQSTIEDLLQQEGGAVRQIIVVDDASPDPYPADTRIIVLRHARNRGFGSAANTGAALADQPWLLILNNDVRVEPDFIDAFRRAAAPLQPAICGLRQWVPRLDAFPPCALRFPTILSTALIQTTAVRRFNKTKWFARLARLPGPEAQIGGRVEWVGGAVLLMPRRAFEELGGFDERYFLYMEEVDLQKRSQERGWSSYLLSEPVLTHFAGVSSANVERSEVELRSRLIYADEWNRPLGARRLVMALWTVIAVDLAVDALRLVVRPDEHPIEKAKDRLATMRRARRERDAKSTTKVDAR